MTKTTPQYEAAYIVSPPSEDYKPLDPRPSSPLDTQVGGSHYKDMAIQPIEFSMKNGFNACQHSIIKYVARYKHKNGRQDLLKARHFIDLLIELEYGNKD